MERLRQALRELIVADSRLTAAEPASATDWRAVEAVRVAIVLLRREIDARERERRAA